MPVATIKVRYLNEPKQEGWSWSIKDDTGRYWSLPDKLSNKFQKGGTYDVMYATTEKEGKDGEIRTYYNIKSLADEPSKLNGHAPVSAPKTTDDEREINIAVLALAKAYQSKLGPIEDLDSDLDLLRAKWKSYLARGRASTKPVPPLRMQQMPQDSMDDEIEF